MKRFSLLTLSTVLALTTQRASADVLDVRGPSPDHAEIKAAVLAAQDGDVIRIWPGTYQAFWIDDKSLTLVSADEPGVVMVNGTYRVRNLAPSASVEISGVSATGTDGYGLVVSDCQGSVRIRESDFVGASASGGWPWNGTSAIFMTNCLDVELTGCTARGGYPAWGEYAGYGGGGMEAEASWLSLYDSTFEGTDGSTEDDPGASGWGGGSGITAWNGGRTYISGCTLIGGDGGDADWDVDPWSGGYGYGGNGGHGYYCPDATTDAWFLDNDYQPGLGGWSPDPGNYGVDGSNTTGGGTFLPGSTRLMVASQLKDDVSTIEIVITGAPGDVAYLQISPAPDYRFDVLHGPFLLEVPLPPRISPWKFLGVIDASGVLQSSIRSRDLPSFGHVTPHFQAHLVGSESYYSPSSWTVVLDTDW